MGPPLEGKQKVDITSTLVSWLAGTPSDSKFNLNLKPVFIL